MKNYIQFVNHASIIISNGKKSILSDPWYYGTSFDDGWKLLFENKKEDIFKILDNINYIWISHEHPDHFSVRFFLDFEDKIKSNNIKIIFQKTKDKKVVKFLEKKSFSFIELENFELFKIDENFELKIHKSGFYDSALLLNIDGKRIFNLNDCPLKSKKEILDFKKINGKCDFLFTQFSYAAWKGGRRNIKWRLKAAEEKIDSIIDQSNILKAKFTIPFASFIYFCDNYNFYLNDSVNTPKKLLNIKDQLNSKILFLKPYQKISLDETNHSDEGFKFWDKTFNDNNLKKIMINEKIFNFEKLKTEFEIYIKKIYKKNSKFLIFFLSLIPFVQIFKPVFIRLVDLGLIVEVDISRGNFKKTNITKVDIEMNSKSLYLIFKENFGYDTLTVNACFEEKSKNGFLKMSKSLSIGNLNNLGVNLNFFSILDLNLFYLFIKKLKFVKKRLNY